MLLIFTEMGGGLTAFLRRIESLRLSGTQLNLYSPEYGNKVDVYVFGLILHEVVTGRRVFPDNYTMS
jgi:hypothetical protein